MIQQQQVKLMNQTSSKIKLSNENYYSHETDFEYQSATWFKKYISCEAEAQAELLGQWKPPDDQVALLMGNYLHSYFESAEAHEAFIAQNQSKLISSKGKTKGQLKSDYKVAETMIEALDSDRRFLGLYQGTKEAIVTGEIYGVQWKGKIDCLNLDRGYFIDLKTSQNLHKRFWNSETHKWQSFIAEYNYSLQMWVYQQLIHQTFGIWCQPYIVAVDKQTVPDKAIISIPGYRLEEAEQMIAAYQERIENVRQGLVKPIRCERCDYCKSTKQLNKIISMDDLLDE